MYVKPVDITLNVFLIDGEVKLLPSLFHFSVGQFSCSCSGLSLIVASRCGCRLYLKSICLAHLVKIIRIHSEVPY